MMKRDHKLNSGTSGKTVNNTIFGLRVRSEKGYTTAMELDAVLDIIREHDENERSQARGRGQGRGQRRSRGRGGRGAQKRKRENLTKEKERRLDQQSQAFNRSGRARTQDFTVPLHKEKLERKQVIGKGGWKKWNAAAVLRAGFGSASAPARAVAEQVDGAGVTHTAASRFVSAACVLKGQDAGIVRLAAAAEPNMAVFIRNVMFDESSFDLRLAKGEPLTECAVFCSHSQWTTKSFSGEVRDEHIIRPPAILPAMNAETMWSALSHGAGGFQPCPIAAKFKATLCTSDAHAANLRLLRYLEQTLPDDHYMLATLCVQHRTGNVVEQLFKLFGTLGANFSVSKTLNKKNLLESIRKKVRDRVSSSLQVVTQTPPACFEEWRSAKDSARRLVRLCCQFEEEGPASAGSRKAAFEDLLQFFDAPWQGPGCFLTCLVLGLRQ